MSLQRNEMKYLSTKPSALRFTEHVHSCRYMSGPAPHVNALGEAGWPVDCGTGEAIALYGYSTLCDMQGMI